MATIKNEYLTAYISTLGAELTSLKDKDGKEYIWEGNPDYWGKHSPVLFPIVGTLKNDTYTFNGKKYQMGRHGFARDREFTVVQQEENAITFRLDYDDATLQLYPFPFLLDITYTLAGKTLNINFSVTNTGNDIMPFSIGAHPAFALPGDFEDYSLTFQETEPLISHRLEDGLLGNSTSILPSENKNLDLKYEIFKDDALIFKSLHSKEIRINNKNRPFIKVLFYDFPHLGIWTKPGAPFLCIEPWQGYSDILQHSGSIENKEGIVVLSGGDSKILEYTIEILS